MKTLFYAGIDVDDKSFHVSIHSKTLESPIEFVVPAKPDKLLKRLRSSLKSVKGLHVCYEAGHLGFSLCRFLRENGIECDIIAPSLTPKIPGKGQKTDRIDANTLGNFSLKGLLTFIFVPDAGAEADRDLVRSRKFLSDQMAAIKSHINSICKKNGWIYRQETKGISYWTKTHMDWLMSKSKNCDQTSTKLNLLLLLKELKQKSEMINLYNEEIQNLAEQKYSHVVVPLTCFRGIDTLSAVGIATEIGPMNRFPHPRNLTSYVGLDVREYSSGGRERKYSISKNGNKWVRTILVEASQFALAPPKESRTLRYRRQNASPESKKIADRCMERLYKKSTRMLFAGKPRNKIKVACAREMIGFIWESLQAA
jgi:transposase